MKTPSQNAKRGILSSTRKPVKHQFLLKTLMALLVFCSLAVWPMQHTQAEKHSANAFSIGLNVYNGTTYNGAIYLYGPTSISATLSPGSSSYGPLTAGSYTVNMYTSAPGTRTFTFNGESVTTSAGYATFNVNISYTSFASIN